MSRLLKELHLSESKIGYYSSQYADNWICETCTSLPHGTSEPRILQNRPGCSDGVIYHLCQPCVGTVRIMLLTVKRSLRIAMEENFSMTSLEEVRTNFFFLCPPW